MKLNNIKKQAGLTLIEVTLVIAVLLGLISVLFIGVSAYKEGSNRSKCILNISNVQKAVRSYQNLYEKNVGDALVQATIAGSGKLLETVPTCPSGGTYTWLGTIPAVGTAYLTCDQSATKDHAPTTTAGW
ncbi:MAG: type II secretion system protein [Verrucomicrobiae bacterium]|nr:type II secretion system protein [Verrucomicrobiae bacterium]